jgi:hypothetical protein
MPTIGVLGSTSSRAEANFLRAFQHGLGEAGYVDSPLHTAKVRTTRSTFGTLLPAAENYTRNKQYIAILVLGGELVEMGGVRCDPRAKPHGKRPPGAQRWRRKQISTDGVRLAFALMAATTRLVLTPIGIRPQPNLLLRLQQHYAHNCTHDVHGASGEACWGVCRNEYEIQAKERDPEAAHCRHCHRLSS